MTSEILALDVPDSLRVLWRRRWLLVSSVLIAVTVAFFGSMLLPQKWESQAVLELGVVGEKPLEDGAALVRRMNLGTIQCGNKDDGPQSSEGITARLDPVPELVEIRLTATAATGSEALARATTVSQCLLRRHDELFAVAQARDRALRHVMEAQLSQTNDNLAALTRLLGKIDAGGKGISDGLLLQARLDGIRAEQLELAQKLRDMDASHSVDRPTVAIVPPTSPAGPVWPRRFLLTTVAGALALFVVSAGVLFATATPFDSDMR